MLFTLPLALKSETILPVESAESELVVTPIIIDHVITVVCDNNMDHIWITNSHGVLVAEAAGALGLAYTINLSAHPAGNYNLAVSTSAGPAQSLFSLR
jgi:hypothetical protein